MEWCQHISPERAKELAEQFPYFSTHNHTEISNFRLRDSIIRIPDLINYAIDLNYAGICCTDHEALSAHVRLIKHYKDLKENNKLPENFKIGLGNEIYLVEDLDNIKRYWHFILIAKDKKGYEQLKRISSEGAWTHWSKGFMERVPTLMSDMEEIIGEEKGHLIFQSACLGSYLDNLILELHKSDYADKTIKKKIDKFIKWCINLAGKDNFYLEIQPSKLHLDENGNKLITDQMIVNQFMFKLSKGYGLKVVVSTDSHFPRPEDAKIHESYLKADDKDKSKEREVASFYETAYMFDKAELIETLSDYLTEEQIIEAFNGTMDVYNKIEFYDLYHPVIVPTDKNLPEFKIRHIFKEYYNDYEYIKKYAESDNVQDQYLLYLVENGFEKRDKWEDTVYHFVTYDYDGKITEEYDKVVTLKDKIKRINEEFSSFWQISEKIDQKLSAYYTLVRGLVQNVMWKRSYVGGGRGSAAGSYLCYLIEITQINPLKFDLPFWRHSSPLRPELPDIDVDTEAGQRQQIFADMRDYYGEPNVLNTLTLRTEGSKATVLALARGFKIPNEDGQFMADLIPFERGANWSFKDCFEGNEEKGRLPQTEFINEVAKYPGFKEALLKIEGLICGRSIHASAAYVFDNGYLVQNSKMRAPNGTWITAFNMEDSDYMGGLKVDCLTIENLDKLHQAIDLLIQDGVIEDKGDIKANYDAYLHPDVLDYNNYEMWNLIDSNKITDAFQFDTPMGKQVIMKTQPRSMIELATANSLMRLMAQEDAIEAPMDTYKRYKNDISLWYNEMKEHHLNDDEIKVLEKHLKSLFGVADTQESIMELSMDSKISGFDVVLANKLRKSVAKKKAKLIDEIHKKFYDSGEKLGTRKEMLDYVWNVQIKRQLGYSFSKNHVTPYTCICIQCMNLVIKYGPVYWNTACLIVNSGSTDEDSDDNKNTNYDKIAKAVSNFQKQSIKISLPNINKSKFGFSPNAKDSEIIYGLKPIQKINTKVAKAIIDNRPYTSAQDFYQKMQNYKASSEEAKFGDIAMITLIKAGCFDELEHKSRTEVMADFIRSISNPVKKLQVNNIEDLNALGLLTPEQKKYELRLVRFKKYLFQKQFFAKQTGKSPTTAYYRLDRKFAEPWFYEHFETDMTEGKDYEYDDEGYIIVKRGSIERVFDKLMANFKDTVLTNPEYLDKLNQSRFENNWKELAPGTISQWEMESLCYYYSGHELAGVRRDVYGIANFDELPTQPEIADTYFYRGQEKARFKLSRICGTVIGKDKNKHTVALLTPDGVVEVKFYKGQFGFYDKQIVELNDDGTKTRLEESWFSRGTKLMITGFRREEQFVPRKYKDSIYNHSVQLIKGIDENGILTLQSERAGQEE